jgi:TusA-related sulfurtransferase
VEAFVKAEIKVECIGETCPLPLVETRKALRKAQEGDIVEVIGTHPSSRKEIPMAVKAMGLELLDVEDEKHGLVKKREPTTIETVRKRLKKVMNPISGLDLVRTNLVKDIQMKDGTVRVSIDLPKNHQFAPAIKEEIDEKIEPLWDVKEVIVDFTE